MSGTARTQTGSSEPAMDEVRQEHNKLVTDLTYFALNRGGTVAPGAAIGAGTKIKIATAAATTYIAGGKPTALGITGNYWDLTTAAQGTTVLVGGNSIKYRLMADSGQNAHVQSSSVAANAANCTFPTQPANNNAVLAMATVSVSAGNNFTPGTTALDGTGVTTTITDGSDGSELTGAKVNLQ